VRDDSKGAGRRTGYMRHGEAGCGEAPGVWIYTCAIGSVGKEIPAGGMSLWKRLRVQDE
jgi:hypothetical protein